MSLERSLRRCVLVVGVVLALVVWPVAGSIGGFGFAASVAADDADETSAVADGRAESFAGGTGTAADPYQVATVEQLQRVDEFLAANFTLIEDIDASKTANWNDGKGFEPIGNDSRPFTGSFDGDGHTISGLYINRTDENDVGLFGQIGQGGNIDRVRLDGVDVTGSNRVGGLVGYNTGTVRNASASGTVAGLDDVGGLVGLNRGTVSDSRASSSVIGSGLDAGGLVGHSLGPVERSHATGDVTGDREVGGLVGYNVDVVRKSYATGNVTGDADVGGLVGYNMIRVVESYAAGNVTGTTATGGLIGFNNALDQQVASAYWDTEATGQSFSDGGGGPLTTAEMTGSAALENMTGFDFENTWVVSGSDDYPELRAFDDGPSGRIEDWNDLDAVRADLDGEYVLVNDLNESTAGYDEVAGPDANNGSGFEPIGTGGRVDEPFVGAFDGDGYTITGLTINQSDQDDVGLFARSEGTLENVTLTDADIVGNREVGGLVAENIGLIRQANSTGDATVSGRDTVGGLVGTNFPEGTITRSHSGGTVRGTGEFTVYGGLVGNNDGSIVHSSSTGEMNGFQQVGGLVGLNGGEIDRSYSEGSVNGKFEAGGLVGKNWAFGSVNRSYSDADVVGNEEIGGIAGVNEGTSWTNRSYSTANVSGNSEVGGLAGSNGGVINNSYSVGVVNGSDRVGGLVGVAETRAASGITVASYWDTGTTNQSDSDGGTGLTTAQMTGEAARENMTGFDFNDTWFVPGPGEYPRLQALQTKPGDETDLSGIEITEVRAEQYLRSTDDRTVVVNVSNRGVTNATENVTFTVPTELGFSEDSVSVQVRENITLEPTESRTLEFELPDINIGPPSDVGFDVSYQPDAESLEITKTGLGVVTAGEVILVGANVSGVDGATPLSAVTDLGADESIGRGEPITVPTESDTPTLRLSASRQVPTTVGTESDTRSLDLFVLPEASRPMPEITADEDQPLANGQRVGFTPGPGVLSHITGRGDAETGPTPDIEWRVGASSGVFDVITDGTASPRAEATFVQAQGQVLVETGVVYPRQPITTFGAKPYRIGTPEEVPPVLIGVDGSDAVYLSDPDNDLEPAGETTISETFGAVFVAPDQVNEVTFAPGWIEDGNVTDTDGSDGWSATFDVSEIPVSERPGPDAQLDVVAVDDEGRTVETVGLRATDPPRWAELIYLGGGEPISSTDGRVAEAITIPPGGFDAQVEPPDKVPIVGGKELGLSGNVQYGVETYQIRRFAARYGEGNLGVDVPVSGPVSVNQSVTIGAAAEYDVPRWRLNGNARFYVIARTLLTAEEQIPEDGIPEGIPVVGGNNVTANAYVGPGYGFELRLSGITGGNLNIEEGLGYANVTAGASAATGVAGQEVFVSVDGEIEGNAVAEIDNEPNRFQRISLANVEFGGSIEGAVGARINAPGVGGEYAQSITLAAGSQDVEQPGPPFNRGGDTLSTPADRVGRPPTQDRVAPTLPASTDPQGSELDRLDQREPYEPSDGRLTDNGLNDTDPAVAGDDGDYAVAWSGEAMDRPESERQEIYVREYVNGSFGDRVRLTNDTAYNVDPTVARANGTTLVAWARIESSALNLSGGHVTFQDIRNRSEIAYAIDDGTGWSEPRVLTNDSRYQGAPAAAAFDAGVVIAYERDGDFDYTTREDTTVRYTRVTPAGRPARNGTLGDGHSPRGAPTADGEAVRLAREHPDGNASVLAVAHIDETGVETDRRERLENLTTFDVAAGGVAWATGGASGVDTVTVAENGTTQTVPVGVGTTVRELRVATTGNRTLLQYQGANPTADDGFLPNARTTYYQLFRDGAWSAPRTVKQAVDTERTIYDHAVTTDNRSFVSVAGAVAFNHPDAVDELYVVDHEYRPDLAVSIPTEERASLADVGVGETVTLNVTVTNTGDVGTDDPVALAVTDGAGTTTQTVDVGAVGAGDRTTVTLTATVPQTGVLGVLADPGGAVTELAESNNRTRVIVEQPRLAIADTEGIPTGDGLQVNATVANVGQTNVTAASVSLTTAGAEFNEATSGVLQPGETQTVTFEPDREVLNGSDAGRITAQAIEPTSQRLAARESVPLMGAAPAVSGDGVRAIQAGGETLISVPIENRGLAGTTTRLEVRYGDRVRSRAVCVPPATVDRPSGYRQALVAVPGLDPGQPVVVALNGSANATAGPTTSVTDRSTVSRVRMQTREIAPLPVVAGRVPTDADCDGIVEDFDGDGTVTDGDLQAFFERRGADSLRVQRPRFDANNDSIVDVHDVQALLAGVENRSGGSPDGPTGETEPDVGFETDGMDVPTDGTRTVDIVVPDVPVGAVNLTVRARDDTVSIVDVEAPGSEYEAHPRNRTGESVLVAAGNGDGERIATVTLAGESDGETSVVVEVADISDDEGTTYATPQDAVLSVNVSTDADDEDGDGNDGDGDGNEGTDSSDETESGFGGPAVLIVVVVLMVAGAAGTYYLRRQR